MNPWHQKPVFSIPSFMDELFDFSEFVFPSVEQDKYEPQRAIVRIKWDYVKNW